MLSGPRGGRDAQLKQAVEAEPWAAALLPLHHVFEEVTCVSKFSWSKQRGEPGCKLDLAGGTGGSP